MEASLYQLLSSVCIIIMTDQKGSTADHSTKPLCCTLLTNRAACYLQLQKYQECIQVNKIVIKGEDENDM